jgi:hypothetical protein
VAEEHRRPQARVVVEVVVRLGQAEEGVRVEPVVDLGPVDPDQDDLAAPLDGVDWRVETIDPGLVALRPDNTMITTNDSYRIRIRVNPPTWREHVSAVRSYAARR